MKTCLVTGALAISLHEIGAVWKEEWASAKALRQDPSG